MDFPIREDGLFTGLLTQDERAKIASILKERGAPKSCECCGKDEWSLGDHLVTPQGLARAADHLRMALGDPFYPSVLLICTNCGNTKLMNLSILGVGEEMFPKGSQK